MKPWQASRQGKVLKLDHPQAGVRYMAHVFRTAGGIAFIEHGWTDPYPGGGNPCHALDIEFEQYAYDDKVWIAIDTPLGDVYIFTHEGPEKPDGTRKAAKEVLQRVLQIEIIE